MWAAPGLAWGTAVNAALWELLLFALYTPWMSWTSSPASAVSWVSTAATLLTRARLSAATISALQRRRRCVSLGAGDGIAAPLAVLILQFSFFAAGVYSPASLLRASWPQVASTTIHWYERGVVHPLASIHGKNTWRFSGVALPWRSSDVGTAGPPLWLPSVSGVHGRL